MKFVLKNRRRKRRFRKGIFDPPGPGYDPAKTTQAALQRYGEADPIKVAYGHPASGHSYWAGFVSPDGHVFGGGHASSFSGRTHHTDIAHNLGSALGVPTGSRGTDAMKRNGFVRLSSVQEGDERTLQVDATGVPQMTGPQLDAIRRLGKEHDSFYAEAQTLADMRTPGRNNLDLWSQYQRGKLVKGFVLKGQVKGYTRLVAGRPIQVRGYTRRAPIFTSFGAEVAASRLPKRGSPQQIAATLRGAGVREEEIEEAGLNELLSQAKGPIEKERVIAAFEGGQPGLNEVLYRYPPTPAENPYSEASDKAYRDLHKQVEEAWMGGWKPEDTAIREALHIGDLGNVIRRLTVLGGAQALPADMPPVLAAATKRYLEVGAKFRRFERKANREERTAGQPKYATYTLPGGKDYHELLLTLDVSRHDAAAMTARRTRDRFKETLKRRHGSNVSEGNMTPKELARWKQLNAKMAETWEKTQVGYGSPHWNEQNVLAHVRFKEHPSDDGKRVLLVEEVQSDWHQAGRERGYRGDVTKAEEEARARYETAKTALQEATTRYWAAAPLKQRIDAIREEALRHPQWEVFDKLNNYARIGVYDTHAEAVAAAVKVHDAGGRADIGTAIREYGPEHARLMDEYQPVYAAYHSARGEAEAARVNLVEAENRAKEDLVPDAPFKKTWHELVMKRMLRWAAEKGFDRLAWTTGSQQAKRYSLSAVAKTLELRSGDAREYHRGVYELAVFPVDGSAPKLFTIEKPTQLDDYVGHAIAGDLRTQLAEREAAGLDQVSVPAEGLEVGGEGMKGFYDKMLPEYLAKYTKRWGGKVGESKILTQSGWAVKLGNGQWLGAGTPAGVGWYSTEREAARQAETYRHLGAHAAQYHADAETVHSIDLTPQLKEHVLKQGQYLFKGQMGFVLKAGDHWRDQPRLPAGRPGGGEWTRGGIGGLAYSKEVESDKPVASFELAPGEGATHGTSLPSFYDLSYNQSADITRHVMDRIASVAVKESGAKGIDHIYGPGGWETYPVTPSGQLRLAGNADKVATAADIIGYLAQQSAVLVHDPDPHGPALGIQIVQQEGDELADPEKMQKFWNRLYELDPEIAQGFAPCRFHGQPGLRIINTGDRWTDEQVAKFKATAKQLTEEFDLHLDAVVFRTFYEFYDNDWKEHPDGQAYLARISQRGRPDLSRRLNDQFRPAVEAWIEDAFKQYAPKEWAAHQGGPGAAEHEEASLGLTPAAKSFVFVYKAAGELEAVLEGKGRKVRRRSHTATLASGKVVFYPVEWVSAPGHRVRETAAGQQFRQVPPAEFLPRGGPAMIYPETWEPATPATLPIPKGEKPKSEAEASRVEEQIGQLEQIAEVRERRPYEPQAFREALAGPATYGLEDTARYIEQEARDLYGRHIFRVGARTYILPHMAEVEVGRKNKRMVEKEVSSSPEEIAEYMVPKMVPDILWQLDQEHSGENWYRKDMQYVLDRLPQVYPEMQGHPELVKLYLMLLAPTSYGADPKTNFNNADNVFRDYMAALKKDPNAPLPVEQEASQIVAGKPTGKKKGYGYRPGTKVNLKYLRLLIQREGGIEGAYNWMKTMHPVAEVEALRAEAGGAEGKIDPRETEVFNGQVYGSMMFGPKGGTFFQNLTGNYEPLTADLWFTRSWRRYLGDVTEVASDRGDIQARAGHAKTPKKEWPMEVSERPVGDPLSTEREAMRETLREVTSEVNRIRQAKGKKAVPTAAVQAALWYYEQKLWGVLGANVSSLSYPDGVEYVNKKHLIAEAAKRLGVKITSKRAIAAGEEAAVQSARDALYSPTPGASWPDAGTKRSIAGPLTGAARLEATPNLPFLRQVLGKNLVLQAKRPMRFILQ